MAIKVAVLYIAVDQGMRMLSYLHPEITSQNEPHIGDEKVLVKDVSKVLFYMFSGMDGKSTNPYTTIKLDRESRKYIHV